MGSNKHPHSEDIDDDVDDVDEIDEDDEQLKILDIPLGNSDDESDEYYSDYEIETESLKWKHISSPWYNYLFEGNKTWDVRLQKNDWNKIKVGEHIMYCGEFNNSAKVCCMEITDIKKFSSFKKLIERIPLQKIFPHIGSEKDAQSLFRTWYSEDDEKKYGVIAINLKKVT